MVVVLGGLIAWLSGVGAEFLYLSAAVPSVAWVIGVIGYRHYFSTRVWQAAGVFIATTLSMSALVFWGPAPNTFVGWGFVVAAIIGGPFIVLVLQLLRRSEQQEWLEHPIQPEEHAKLPSLLFDLSSLLGLSAFLFLGVQVVVKLLQLGRDDLTIPIVVGGGIFSLTTLELAISKLKTARSEVTKWLSIAGIRSLAHYLASVTTLWILFVGFLYWVLEKVK
ncbi:MAG: hypothetical protein ACK4HB_00890 [Candidatus Bipolaricaulia bacterium]